MKKITFASTIALLTATAFSQPQTINTPIAEQTPETRKLIERNNEFREEIIQLADNVYTASGYDVAGISQ